MPCVCVRACVLGCFSSFIYQVSVVLWFLSLFPSLLHPHKSDCCRVVISTFLINFYLTLPTLLELADLSPNRRGLMISTWLPLLLVIRKSNLSLCLPFQPLFHFTKKIPLSCGCLRLVTMCSRTCLSAKPQPCRRGSCVWKWKYILCYILHSALLYTQHYCRETEDTWPPQTPDVWQVPCRLSLRNTPATCPDLPLPSLSIVI